MATVRNSLRDVDPTAITICKQGANRQRIMLKKAAPEPTVLLTERRLLKSTAEEWSTFYCVVAEPGAEEDPGMTGDQDSVDVWDDPDEIRKAAHRLLKNAAYVNAKHDDPAAEGAAIVESAVALNDFDVVAADGGEAVTVKKGSWYVGIELPDELRKQVDAGEVTGISLEGSGIRVPLEKADPKAQGTKGKDRDAGGTHRTCPKCSAKVKFGVKTCPNCKAAIPSSNKGALKKLWAALMPEEPMPEQLAKTNDFADVIAERELQDSLYRAWWALEGVIFDAFRDEDEADPKGVVTRSLAQFETYLLEKLDTVPADQREGLAKELASVRSQEPEEELDTMPLTAEETAEIAEIKKSGEETATAVAALSDGFKTLLEHVKGEGKEPVKKAGDDDSIEGVVEKLGKVADAVDKLDTDLTTIAASVESLGEGASTQPAESQNGAVRKSNPLAGLLS